MKWYQNLYLGEGLSEKKDKLIRKIERHAGTPGLFVITLAANGKDLFDIFSTNMLLQPVLHGICPVIIGITNSREEAVQWIQELVITVHSETGNLDVISYLEKQVEDGKPFAYEYPLHKLKKKKRLFCNW